MMVVVRRAHRYLLVEQELVRVEGAVPHKLPA